MRIGLCQYETSNNFKANLAKVLRGAELADRDRVEILCFPECFLTGYQDEEAAVRKYAIARNSAPFLELLDKTARFNATLIVGFNELHSGRLRNSAAVLYKGHVLDVYSKCMTLLGFHEPGREFPVFDRGGVKFGVVICADGGFIEPARILALKGAQIIFAPHFNYISIRSLIQHYEHVRKDHVARATENTVYFVRANNVGGRDPAITEYEGQAYGDSYIVDPWGEIVIRTRRHKESLIFADVDLTTRDTTRGVGRSCYSIRELSKQLLAAAESAAAKPGAPKA